MAGALLTTSAAFSLPAASYVWDSIPAVASGYTRYWAICSNEISAADKAGWLATPANQAYNFASSSANPAVSNQHYTGAAKFNAAITFGANGWLSATYPGGSAGIVQYLLHAWQPGGWTGTPGPYRTVFADYHFANDLDSPYPRYMVPGRRYRIGWDCRFDGLNGADPVNRNTFFKIKHYYDVGDYQGNVIAINLQEVAPSHRFDIFMSGDSDLVTPSSEDAEFTLTANYTGVINNKVYRFLFETVLGINNTGESYLWITPRGGATTQVVNQPAVSNYLATNEAPLGDINAGKAPYWGTYISDVGHGGDDHTAEFDNLFIDVED